MQRFWFKQHLGGSGGGGGGGGGGTRVSISDQNPNKTGNGLSPATASISYNTTGLTKDQNSTTLETWLVSGAVADYEIRATQSSGTPATTGALGTWLSLSANRAWTRTVNPGHSFQTVLLVEIRDAITHVTLDSALITLDVFND